MCAVGGFVHSVSLLQQLEELLHRDPWVRRPSQREDLPHQDPVGPPGHTDGSRCEVHQVWRRWQIHKQSCFGGTSMAAYVYGSMGLRESRSIVVKDDSGGEEERSHLTCAPWGVEREPHRRAIVLITSRPERMFSLGCIRFSLMNTHKFQHLPRPRTLFL